jgi:hypothetical protein
VPDPRTGRVYDPTTTKTPIHHPLPNLVNIRRHQNAKVAKEMPSFTSFANSAANGWRKLKEETLTYTPPANDGQKPVRSPERKLRKMSVTQFTDLPRGNLRTKTSKEFQLGLPQSYTRLCETDRFFRDRMPFGSGVDGRP